MKVGDRVKVRVVDVLLDAEVLHDFGPLAHDGKRLFNVQLTGPDVGEDPLRFDVHEDNLVAVEPPETP